MANVQELIVKLKAENSDLKKKLADSKKDVGGFKDEITSLGKGIASAFTVAAVLKFGQASFAAFEESEKASKKLLFALNGSKWTYKELTDQADKLRDATGIDDEDIKQIQMLGVSSGKSASEVKKITQAAIELSARTGQDLQSAYMILNGTLTGSAGRLGRVDAEFTKLTAEQLKNGEAIDLVLKKWSGGAADAATETSKLKTNWGEFQESVGKSLSVVLIPLLQEMNKQLTRGAKGWQNWSMKGFYDPKSKEGINLLELIKMQQHEEKMAGFEKQRVALTEQIAASSEKMAKFRENEKNSTEKTVTALELYIKKMEELYKKQQNWNDNAVQNATGGMFNSNLPSMKPKSITTGKNTSYFDVQAEGAARLTKNLQDLKTQLAFVASEERSLQAATIAGNTAMDAFNTIVNDGSVSLQSLAEATYNSARQAIAAELAQGIAAVIRSALTSVPFPLNLVIAAGAGAAAGTLFNTLVPKLAGGGLAYGQTNAIVGEYPGAKTNPEVIAPLNKLQDLLGGGTQRIEIYGTLRDDHIALSNQRGQRKLNLRG